MRSFIIIAVAITLSSFCARRTSAQVNDGKCRGSIYSEQEVTRPAKINGPPDFQQIYLGFGRNMRVHAVVDAILCRSGRVTDIKVVEVSPPEVKDFVIAALSLVSFTPAEMSWHTVSQRQRFEFNTSPDGGIDANISKKAQGRLIEEIEVIGNRKITKEQILSWTHSRVGEPYDTKTINEDLRAILHSGRIDALQSRVTLEDGMRGGVIIHFEVVELPTIVAVKFSRLKETDQAIVLNSLVDRQADIRPGAPLDAAKLKIAVRVITDFFESKGWRDIKVDVQTELLSATEVTVTFSIAGYKFQ
jgi:surface antigen-like variable number repeat protein